MSLCVPVYLSVCVCLRVCLCVSVCVPTGGAGVDHAGSGQLVLQVQHGLAHLGGRGVLGFVALVENNLQREGV